MKKSTKARTQRAQIRFWKFGNLDRDYVTNAIVIASDKPMDHDLLR
jgi:hypothetical protein